MNSDRKKNPPAAPETSPAPEESSLPLNEGIDIPSKAKIPDEDRTVEGTMPTLEEEATEGVGEDTLVQEHHTGRDHAEPTAVTGTSNDNAIESEYIDIGGGD